MAAETTTRTSSVSGGNSPLMDNSAIKPDSLSVQLNLNLYNFDNPDAQFCPYVLTSPRSLEACSNLGVKPVELLPKPLTEFKKQISQVTNTDDLLRLYQEMEQNRIEKLEKCRYERKAMILSQKKIQRSLSASPLSQRKQEYEFHNREKSHTPDNRYSFDEALAEESDDLSRDSHQSRTESFRSKRSRRRNDSWSAPTSPFRSVLMSSVVPITSPVLVSKLKDSPRFGLSLPSKDIKLMELMVHRHQSQIAEEEMKACARQIWAEELENFHRRQQADERERWNRLASLTTRDEVQERLQEVKNRISVMQQQKRRELLDKEEKLRKNITEHHAMKRQKSARSREISEERKKIQEKRLEETQKQETEEAQAHLSEVQQHLEKAFKAKTQKEQKIFTKLKIQNQKDEEKRRWLKAESTHSSLCESEMQLEALHLKDTQVSERKEEITMQRQSSLKKKAETVEDRQRQAKLNQSELDKALEKWRDKVSNYQKEANYRALQRASENIESRRAKVREERLAKEAEHRRNLERIRAEEEARYLERLLKMVDREKQTEAFLHERDAAIEQSRLIAQASSDLREHLRQKLEEDVLKPPKALIASSFKTPGPPTPARRKCLKELRKSKSFFC